ncbi:kinase-like domain-containing protein [Xylogone sp. PMI_703]|nr:kinase-like domain-containing protein [Xylogone sp. PMI_703]
MKSQRVLKHGDILTVRLAEFDLTIQLPDHTQHAEQAEKYWAEYLAKFASWIPSLRDLDLQSLRSSTGASQMIYSLESEIGRGKHGLVYRAIHQRTGQVFAAKKYYDMQASALREGAIMQHILHRNIVKFHDYISTGQVSPLLIMEFIPEPRKLWMAGTANKVDIWSVGIMTLELSDLGLPQCPEAPDELPCVIENHLRITPSPLTNFISHLVQHNPDRRPSADESVCDDFFNIDLDFTEIASADLIPTSQPTQRKRQISTSLLSDYQELIWNGRAVNWVPSKGIINLTQLLAASGMVKKERDRVLKKYVDKCREQSAAGNNATKGSYFLLHDAFDICKALGFGYETIEKLMYGYTDLERCHPVQNHSQVHAKDAIICGSILLI